MQTFLPYADFAECARVLDPRRLGNQRTEALVILRVCHIPTYGWQHHPAVRMWRGYELALMAYGRAICEEWIGRGHADTVLDKLAEWAPGGQLPTQAELAERGLLPPWLGDERLHRSHRSALLRKDPAWYGPGFPGVPDDLPYHWPVAGSDAKSAERAWNRSTAGRDQDSAPEEEQMASIEESIVVNVPLRTAYNQWTQFEEFPRFMEGVEEVRQLDDKRLHWVAKIGGKREEWDAEITEQRPDERVAWASLAGRTNAGVVTFHRISDDETKVMVQIDYEPEGMVESIGDAMGVARRRTEGDLERFKEYIEGRGTETGGWRGEIGRESA